MYTHNYTCIRITNKLYTTTYTYTLCLCARITYVHMCARRTIINNTIPITATGIPRNSTKTLARKSGLT